MTKGGVAPVLVTGSTGGVGRMVVDELVSAGVPVRALARRPADARLPPEADVVAGDFDDAASVDAGLQGVGSVFLVWTPGFDSAPAVVERLARHGTRVVFLSAPHRTPHPFFSQPNPMAQLHAELERLMADAGLTTTVLRPGMLDSNALSWWAPTIRRGDPVRWPYGAAATAPLDDRDLGAVAARVLLDESHASGDYVLTGPDALSQEEQVSILGSAIGRDVVFEEITPEEFRRETADSWPTPVVDMLLGAWGATLGHRAFVTTTVLDVLGTPPRTFRTWATDHATAFA
jgi:uncharacterized protein YbjT (DUF2867 family)